MGASEWESVAGGEASGDGERGAVDEESVNCSERFDGSLARGPL
jgi:hypothetical protein